MAVAPVAPAANPEEDRRKAADTCLNDGEVRVLLALNALDWNEKGVERT